MSKRPKAKAHEEPTDEEELALQELVFGSSSSGSRKRRGGSSAGDDEVTIELDRRGAKPKAKSSGGAVWHDEDDAEVQVDLLATDRLKKLGRMVAAEEDDGDEDGDGKKQKQKQKKKKTVVSGTELSSLLKERFQTRQLDWAKVQPDDEAGELDDPDLAVLRQADSMVLPSSSSAVGGGRGKKRIGQAVGRGGAIDGPLPEGKIDIMELADANAASRSKETITAVSFHSSETLLLTGGEDRHLRFFRVDGKSNDLVLTVKFSDTSVSSAAFLGASAEVVLSGRKPFFYGYDTESGRVSRFPGLQGKGLKSHENMVVAPDGSKLAFLGAGGYVHVASGKHKTWMMDLKMNCAARSAAFVGDDYLVTSGLDADVYLWDLRMQGRCVSRVKHEDGTCTSSLAALPASSRGPQRVAVGAESGAVTLWTGALPLGAINQPQPAVTKSFMQLRTPVTTLAFHPSGELLVTASKDEKDQMRLLHVGSGSAFGNWPTPRTPLRRVQTVAFSPSGAYMVAGNNAGRVLLWRLNHYS